MTFLQFGAVFKCSDNETNLLVAVKIFKLTTFHLTNDLGKERQKQLKEAKIIQKLDHPNVISILHLVNEPDEICLVFPLMVRSIEDEIKSTDYQYNQQRTKEVISMILSGLAHMHHNNIMHRDLKLANILVDGNSIIKIADFGLATEFVSGRSLTAECGTEQYMAPEMFLRRGYTESVDIWVSVLIVMEKSLFSPKSLLNKGFTLYYYFRLQDAF